MRSRKNRGQFSIIAALFVSVILVSSVMFTYSSVRYSNNQSQPQILSAVDETNLALKQVLGFTVGYYGSVLQVTGDSSYAKTLASRYLDSGLENIADIRPEWGTSISVNNLTLNTCWFMNSSYSQGNLEVTYDLTGLGITGLTYSVSSRLDVSVFPSAELGQVCLNVTREDGQACNDLSIGNFKFYLYRYSNSTWDMVAPLDAPVAFPNGTYLIDIPSGIDPYSYVVQVADTRGISVAASSFSHYTGKLAFNSTVVPGGDFVDLFDMAVDGSPDVGTHSSFTAQQDGPDGINDVLTAEQVDTLLQDYFPTTCITLGQTTIADGSVADLEGDDGDYMQFHSYGTSFFGSSTFGYSGSGSSTQTLEGRIRGSVFTMDESGEAQSITAYIDLSSTSSRNVKAAIYSEAHEFIKGTEQKAVTADGWVTFNFADPKPVLVADTDYVLVAWAESGSGDVNIAYHSGTTDQGHRVSESYGDAWPTSPNFSHEDREYRIYCTYSPATEYACEVELSGTSDTNEWDSLIWTTVSSVTAGDASATFRLFNYDTGQFPTSGDGYLTATLGTTDRPNEQTIGTYPTNFRDTLGTWRLKITATKTTPTPFDLRVDLTRFRAILDVYSLDVEEQWTDVNMTYLNSRSFLCINAGELERALALDIWQGSSWQTVSSSLVSGWNNISISSYLTAPNFTIRLHSGAELVQDTWEIDAVLLRPGSDQDLFTSLQDSTATVAVELLQNGTMWWMGQNLQLTTNAIPIPPVPVKAIQVREKIDEVWTDVPFQVEDWASEYTIPLGLTNNATVFGSRQMIVFLVNTHVSEFTIWWNGSDQAAQTSLAYTNSYFDDTSTALSNGVLSLSVTDAGSFTVTSTVAGETTSSTQRFMRINNEASVYGAGSAYVICNGTVRDIIQQEAEWNDGALDCPNIYANIVLTLPAHASYYTYQLSLTFISSAQQRRITDLCPLKVTSLVSPTSTLTENGTASSIPITSPATGAFYNYEYPSSQGTYHHWSQFTWSSGSKGTGVMFTDSANGRLYAFDSAAGDSVGSLKVDSGQSTIEVSPVTLNRGEVSDLPTPNGLELAWCGAVVTFDGTTPIYSGSDTPGLWVLAELPPKITVTTDN